MNLVRSLSFLLLSASCALLCVGCGTLSTDYTFSAPATAQQKRQIMQAVDSTARRLDLKRQTGSSFESEEGFFHTYLDRTLTIQTSSEGGRAYVSLYKTGRTRSPDFVRAEEVLTPALRRIDPRLTIKTGYAQNPMM